MQGFRAGVVAAVVAAVVIAGGVALTGCVAAVIGSAPHSGTATDTRARASGSADAKLADTVRARFDGIAALRTAAIDISAYSGTVTLRGTAATSAARGEAERVTRGVTGVAMVDNQLKVK